MESQWNFSGIHEIPDILFHWNACEIPVAFFYRVDSRMVDIICEIKLINSCNKSNIERWQYIPFFHQWKFYNYPTDVKNQLIKQHFMIYPLIMYRFMVITIRLCLIWCTISCQHKSKVNSSTFNTSLYRHEMFIRDPSIFIGDLEPVLFKFSVWKKVDVLS